MIFEKGNFGKKVVRKSDIEHLREHICEFLDKSDFISVSLVRMEKNITVWCWLLNDKRFKSANQIAYCPYCGNKLGEEG